jgi:hypothetical protein
MNGKVCITMPIARPKLKSHIFTRPRDRCAYIRRPGQAAQGLESHKADGAGLGG